ncbi:MAG: 50S ribosomal protein L29 [Patescibacteria group bacterium]|mgnify:CR=1 FL=1
MKKTTYTGKAKADLVKALYEKREALRAFRFGEAGSKTRNVKEGAGLRKDVARIMTELNK